MIHAFQDRENLYLIMELMPGGDLRYHISKKRRFNEEQTSNKIMKGTNILINSIEFFVACIVQGLEYLHMNGCIHRDIKPENLVLDHKGWDKWWNLIVKSDFLGYVRITDLGIARIWRPENSSDTSGTPGYMGNSYDLIEI